MVSNYVLWDFCVGEREKKEREIEPPCFLCFYLWLFFCLFCPILGVLFCLLTLREKEYKVGEVEVEKGLTETGWQKTMIKIHCIKNLFSTKKTAKIPVISCYRYKLCNTGLPCSHIFYLWSHLHQHVAQKHTSKTDFKSWVFFTPSIPHMTLAPHSLQYPDLLLY